MEELPLDPSTIFTVENSVFELIIRGSILYIGILIFIRLLPRRAGGELAMMDLIFVILIAQAATNSLGDYKSVTEGFIVISTIMLWNFLVNYLSYHFAFIEKLVSAPPLQIIRNGKLLRRNMRREYVTENELMDSLRLEGIEDVNEIKSAYIEGDGKISFIKKKVKKK